MKSLNTWQQTLIRSLLLVGFLLFVLPISAQKQYEVTSSKLTVRSQAKSSGSALGSVKKGDLLSVFDIKDGWAEISFNGRIGYVSSRHLKAKSSLTRENRSLSSSSLRYDADNDLYESSHSPSRANTISPSSGLGMTADIGLGYKDHVFSTTLSFDIGYQLKRMLYFGAGPMLEADFNDAGSSFSAGGQAKVLFVAPLKGNVAPLVGARIGYLYNFKSESGGLFYGGDLGICIKQHYAIGLRGNISSHKEVSQRVYWDDVKGKNIKETREHTKYDFVPFLFFSYLF